MLHQFKADVHSYYQEPHHGTFRKLWLVVLLLPLMLFLTSCLKVEVNYIFRDDGSATMVSRQAMDKHQYAALFLYGFGSEDSEFDCETIFRQEPESQEPERNENSHFGFFGDWITDVPPSVVSVDTTLHDIGNECVVVTTEEIPPGTLSDSFDDGRLEVNRYPDGKWSMHLWPDESYTGSDSVIDEDRDHLLDGAEAHMSVTLPGQPIRHNAHFASTSSGSTLFLWQNCDYNEFEEWYGSTQFADTEPSSDTSKSTDSRSTGSLSENCTWSKLEDGIGGAQFADIGSSTGTSNTTSTALIIAIAAVVFTVIGSIPFWANRKHRLESDSDVAEEAPSQDDI